MASPLAPQMNGKPDGDDAEDGMFPHDQRHVLPLRRLGRENPQDAPDADQDERGQKRFERAVRDLLSEFRVVSQLFNQNEMIDNDGHKQPGGKFVKVMDGERISI